MVNDLMESIRVQYMMHIMCDCNPDMMDHKSRWSDYS